MKKTIGRIFLATLFLCAYSLAGTARTEVQIRANATSRQVTAGFSEGEPVIYDFSGTTNPSVDLSTATAITVEGTWNNTQLGWLKSALGESRTSTTPNEKLLTADMSAVELSGTISQGAQSLFRYCTSLTTVTLPEQTHENEINFQYAFSGCTQLTSVVNLDRFTKVSSLSQAFDGCSNLVGVTLPQGSSATATGFFGAFRNCKNLRSVTNLNYFINVNSFGSTFNNCSQLQTVTLPEEGSNFTGSVSFISTFSGCTKLTSVVNLDQFTNVQYFENTFENCSDLETITLPEGSNSATCSFKQAFSGCSKLTTVVNLDQFTNVTSFMECFNSCSKLRTITLSATGSSSANGITFQSAFSNCTELTSVVNLDKFTNVTDFHSTFFACSQLQSVTLPEGTTADEISFNSIFQRCGMLSSIENLEKFTNITTLSNTFRSCSSLKTITLPQGTSYTGSMSVSYAFAGCTALLTVENFDKFTNVTGFTQTFYGCASLMHIKLGETVTATGRFTFDGCNPNLLVYLSVENYESVKDNSEWSGRNFISNEDTPVALSDIKLRNGSPYGPIEAFGLNGHTLTFTYREAVANQWYAAVLPFALAPSGKPTADMKTVLFNEIAANKPVFTINDRSIPAGTPFLFSPSSGGNIQFTATGTDLQISNALATVSHGGYTLSGTYCAGDLPEPGELYRFTASSSGGCFDKLTSENALTPFEAYLTTSSASPDEIAILMRTSSIARAVTATIGETESDFDYGFDTDPGYDLSQSSSIQTEGTWNDTQLGWLKAALGQDRTSSSPNTALLTADMGSIILDGDISTGFQDFFKSCTLLHAVTLPNSIHGNPVSFKSAFQDCYVLNRLKNMEQFTNVGDFQQAFLNCSSLTSLHLGNKFSIDDNAFENANPNLLIYLSKENYELVKEETGWSGRNFISNEDNPEAFADIRLTDGYAYGCDQAFKLGDHAITYTRDFTGNLATSKSGWNTLCLPFDGEMTVGVTASDTQSEALVPFSGDSDTEGEFWLKEYSGVSAGNTEILEFAYPQNYMGIKAYTPYLIALPGDEFGTSSLSATPVATFKGTALNNPGGIAATPERSGLSTSGSDGNYLYVCNFDTLRSEGIYILRSDANGYDVFACPPAGIQAGVLPFRAYFATVAGEGSAAPVLRIGNEEGTTGIFTPVFTSSEEIQVRKVLTPSGLRIIDREGKVYNAQGVWLPEEEVTE